MSPRWAALFGSKPASPAPAAPTFGARRPLVDIHGEVAGFEFRLSPAKAEQAWAWPAELSRSQVAPA